MKVQRENEKIQAEESCVMFARLGKWISRQQG